MISKGDRVKIKDTAPKCCIHRGMTGVVEKIRYSGGIAGVYFVKFEDGRTDLHKLKDLEKIDA